MVHLLWNILGFFQKLGVSRAGQKGLPEYTRASEPTLEKHIQLEEKGGQKLGEEKKEDRKWVEKRRNKVPME